MSNLIATWAGALVAVLAPVVVAPAGAETRHYYVAAEEVVWDHAPMRKALILGPSHGDGVPKS